jgi:hypothetical protein
LRAFVSDFAWPCCTTNHQPAHLLVIDSLAVQQPLRVYTRRAWDYLPLLPIESTHSNIHTNTTRSITPTRVSGEECVMMMGPVITTLCDQSFNRSIDQMPVPAPRWPPLEWGGSSVTEVHNSTHLSSVE